MNHDELEREIDRLRLAHATERAEHAATDGILRRVRAGLMSTARDTDQRHAVELAFSLLAGAEGNDAAASAQVVATALLVAVDGWNECRVKIASIVAKSSEIAGVA